MGIRIDSDSNIRLEDLLWRSAYRLAYGLSLLFFFIFRPAIHGVNIAVWQRDHVLIIKNGYKSEYGFPGGYIGRHETDLAAAVRELKEEVALTAAPYRMHRVGDFAARHEFKRDTVTFFEFHPESMPQLSPDRREVIWARFIPREAALHLPLSPMARQYLRSRSA